MIIIAVKLATSITYTADGSQTNFSVPFDYLRPSYVHVAINDAEVSEGFTISNRMVMFDSAPTKDAAVHIYRSTPTTRLVSWADASILKAIDMTIAEVQQLHILEETNDWTKTNSIVLNDEGNAWQGRNYRVSNVSDPTEAQDVVTKHYLDNEEGSFTATMNALKTKTEEAANTAATNAKQAKTSETNAKTSETNAKTSETNAKTSETNANTSKEAAQSAANSASNFATDARSSANEAKSYRDAASTYATNAKNYSENVNVFVPSVSAEGVLSWSNKAGLTNPPSVNIKGKDGADGGVTVDSALSSTSTNPVQNRVIYTALTNKLDKTGTALKATKDDAGNTISTTYAKKTDISGMVKSVNGTKPDASGNVSIAVSGGSNVTVDTTLSATSTNAIQNKAVYAALSDKLDKSDVAIGAQRALQDGDGNIISLTYVKSVNGTKPDSNGNVSISTSGGDGGGASTSTQNTWTALQNFHDLMLNREKYTTYVVNGTSDKPVTSTMVYAVIGAFTLDLATLAGLLSASQSSVFTAYFAANADYSLTINNAGKLKYVGSASDIAITSAGLLLNIWMSKDGAGTLTSIVQASKLS
jgi:hypothetical protein